MVEASVFAEWFLQQARDADALHFLVEAKGERMEQFLTTLIGEIESH